MWPKLVKSLTLALVLVLLSACGAGSTATVPTAVPEPTAIPTAIPAPTAAPVPTTAPVAEPEPTSAVLTPVLPATVTDYQGETVVVESVDRIVSLTGDITEIIFALGMGDYIVGVDSSATYPAEKTKSLPNIGYQRRLNAEGILALNPTLLTGWSVGKTGNLQETINTTNRLQTFSEHQNDIRLRSDYNLCTQRRVVYDTGLSCRVDTTGGGNHGINRSIGTCHLLNISPPQIEEQYTGWSR